MEATALAAASKPSFASTSTTNLEAVDRPSSSLHSHLQRRRRLLLRTRGFANSLLPTRRWKGGCLLYAYVLYKSKLFQGRRYGKTFGGYKRGIFSIFFIFTTYSLFWNILGDGANTHITIACILELGLQTWNEKWEKANFSSSQLLQKFDLGIVTLINWLPTHFEK